MFASGRGPRFFITSSTPAIASRTLAISSSMDLRITAGESRHFSPKPAFQIGRAHV